MNNLLARQIQVLWEAQIPQIKINQALILKGYSPTEIETAWQEVSELSHQKPAFDHSPKKNYLGWSFGLGMVMLVVIGSSILLSSDSYSFSDSFVWLLLSSPIMVIMICVLIFRQIRRSKRLVIIVPLVVFLGIIFISIAYFLMFVAPWLLLALILR